jgi:putative restriction endonuclease
MALAPFERIRLDKAAVDEGFGIRREGEGHWLAYESLGAPAAIRLTAVRQGYVAAVDHDGVAADLATRWPAWDGAAPPGFTAFVVPDTAPLHDLVREMWRLARALPLAPLRAFEQQIRDLPRATAAERGIVQRVGQDLFRAALMDYWGGRCAVTGCAEPLLLRARHIRPWALCATDAERLDVYNGLLLAAHLDAAFDAGLIDFDDASQIRFAERFAPADRRAAGLTPGMALAKLTPEHQTFLAWRRDHLLTAGTRPPRLSTDRPIAQTDQTQIFAGSGCGFGSASCPAKRKFGTQRRAVVRYHLDIERQFEQVPNGPSEQPQRRPGVREGFRGGAGRARCTAVREKRRNFWAFQGRSTGGENVAPRRPGGGTGPPVEPVSAGISMTYEQHRI